MPNMVTKLSAVVRFGTTSDDYRALVRGKGVERKIRAGAAVPTEAKGLYTVTVFDRQLRTVTATLSDTSTPPVSNPPSAKKSKKEFVTLLYEVK